MGLDELERNMKFMQYGRNGPEREKAVGDIRKLIQKYGNEKIYLWDPYIEATDIMDTLYYSATYGTEMRVIGKHSQGDANEWALIQKNKFETDSNNYGVNLEFRRQSHNYGYPFHDRFLIFFDDRGTVRAWSLGTSVAGLGKRHHIVQEVNHPKHIADAFEQLWEQLGHPECLVWKSRNN
jgi:hypothetical protein